MGNTLPEAIHTWTDGEEEGCLYGVNNVDNHQDTEEKSDLLKDPNDQLVCRLKAHT